VLFGVIEAVGAARDELDATAFNTSMVSFRFPQHVSDQKDSWPHLCTFR